VIHSDLTVHSVSFIPTFNGSLVGALMSVLLLHEVIPMWWRLLDVTSIGRGLDPSAGHWTRGVQIEAVPSNSSSSQSCYCRYSLSTVDVTDVSLAPVNNLASISVHSCPVKIGKQMQYTQNQSILVCSLGWATSPDPNTQNGAELLSPKNITVSEVKIMKY